jgi:hypothetical protein
MEVYAQELEYFEAQLTDLLRLIEQEAEPHRTDKYNKAEQLIKKHNRTLHAFRVETRCILELGEQQVCEKKIAQHASTIANLKDQLMRAKQTSVPAVPSTASSLVTSHRGGENRSGEEDIFEAFSSLLNSTRGGKGRSAEDIRQELDSSIQRRDFAEALRLATEHRENTEKELRKKTDRSLSELESKSTVDQLDWLDRSFQRSIPSKGAPLAVKKPPALEVPRLYSAEVVDKGVRVTLKRTGAAFFIPGDISAGDRFETLSAKRKLELLHSAPREAAVALSFCLLEQNADFLQVLDISCSQIRSRAVDLRSHSESQHEADVARLEQQ